MEHNNNSRRRSSASILGSFEKVEYEMNFHVLKVIRTCSFEFLMNFNVPKLLLLELDYRSLVGDLTCKSSTKGDEFLVVKT